MLTFDLSIYGLGQDRLPDVVAFYKEAMPAAYHNDVQMFGHWCEAQLSTEKGKAFLYVTKAAKEKPKLKTDLLAGFTVSKLAWYLGIHFNTAKKYMDNPDLLTDGYKRCLGFKRLTTTAIQEKVEELIS